MKCDTKYVLYNVYDILPEVEGSHMGLHKWCKHNEFHVFDNQKKKKIGHYITFNHTIKLRTKSCTIMNVAVNMERGGLGGTYTAL